MLTLLRRWVSTRLPVMIPLLRRVRYRGFSGRGIEFYRSFADKQSRNQRKIRAFEWMLADPALPERFTVLDVGCGPGGVAAVLRAHPEFAERVTYTGVDQNEDAIAFCRSEFPDRQFVVRDVLADGLPEGGFDVIMINEVVEHMPSYEPIFEAILARRPKVFVITSFGVVPEAADDRRLWRRDTQCYMNTYSAGRMYRFLRRRTRDLMLWDEGTSVRGRYWFPVKAKILWYAHP